MPVENDWILLANYNDKTFLRNSLAFEIFRKMGHYAPRTQYCEILLNGNYQGIYVLTEKIKRDRGRVNIANLGEDENDGDDITGGYIFKIDYFNNNDSWLSSFSPPGYPDKEVRFVYHYPKSENITDAQKVYIRKFVHDLELILYSPNTVERRKNLYDRLDIDSFIDYFIVSELSRNVDAYKKSAYFFKGKDSKGGKLHAGPVWDFDWAWKNINECFFGATDGSGWAYQVHLCDPWPVPPGWMQRLLEDPYFAQKLAGRYNQLRSTYLSENFINGFIDSVATVLHEPQMRHFKRWPILGINVGTPEVDPQPATYEGEIEKLKTWISKRLKWLDANIVDFVITDLEDHVFKTSNSIYPNPTSSKLTIESSETIKNIYIFSLNGKSTTYDGVYTRKATLSTEDLSPGLYIIKTEGVDGQIFLSKFVKAE